MIYAEAHGITIEVGSEDPKFEEFFARDYAAFLTTTVTPPSIKVRFGPAAGSMARERCRAMASLGMGIHYDENSLYWENEFGFVVLTTANEERDLQVDCYHFDLERERSADWLARNYLQSLRWAVHFPLFRLLCWRKGLHLAHATAVARQGQGVVFCGLNKVGKSTLGAYLSMQSDYRFITDNYLLWDETTVYGFSGALQLDGTSLSNLQMNGEGLPTAYGKSLLTLEAAQLCNEADPTAFFLVVNGPSLAADPIAGDHAGHIVSGLQSYLGDSPEQSYLAALPLLCSFSGEAPQASHELFPDKPWFRLSLPKDWELGDIKELVEACI